MIEWSHSVRQTDIDMMRRCIVLAEAAADSGNYALGSLVAMGGDVIAESGSSLVQSNDPSAHPEMEVVRAAARSVGSRYLSGATLYTTLEPCPMCTAATIWAKFDRIVFGASQEDAIEWATAHPDPVYTWRQISLKAAKVAEAGDPKVAVTGEVLHAECVSLFSKTVSS